MAGHKALNDVFMGSQFIGTGSCGFDQNKVTRPGLTEVERAHIKAPEIKFKRDPMTDSAETVSTDPDNVDQTAGEGGEEYRIQGLTWHTPDFLNTCHMDSFISAWIRRVRQTHGHVLRFIENLDEPGRVLTQIGDMALCSKQRLNSTDVKALWLQIAFKNAGSSIGYVPTPIDCIGRDIASIFQHLKAHCGFLVEVRCKCGTQFHEEFAFDINKIEMILQLVEGKDKGSLKMTKCEVCGQTHELIRVNRSPGNWLIAFKYWNSRVNPEFSDIPKGLTIDGATYELTYLGYCQKGSLESVQHHVSIHNVRGYYHLYDGIRSPGFSRYCGLRYIRKNARLETIVYFRRN